jgi:hypothetical protein
MLALQSFYVAMQFLPLKTTQHKLSRFQNTISIAQATMKLLQTTPNIINIILFQYTQSKHSSMQYILFQPHCGHLTPDDLI